eukprot:scaffold24853_cov78-Skeletonema_marinoi.AAC.1
MAKLMAAKRASTTTTIKSLGVTAEWGFRDGPASSELRQGQAMQLGTRNAFTSILTYFYPLST